jgi:cyclopropane fatty-acyl-phospholipid synthase-like methyltransferase
MTEVDEPVAHEHFKQRIEQHYADLFARYGDSSRTAQYPDRHNQEARFRILSQIGIAPDSKILDFGCGLGDLLGYLRQSIGYHGEYVGYDLSVDILAAARRKVNQSGYQNARFEHRDIFKEPPAESFDYTVVCGSFNVGYGDNNSYIPAALRLLFAATKRGLAFNLMSTYVDYFDPGLYYAEPEVIFAYCKEELSPAVTLRHDYLLKPDTVPYEFTVYVHRVLPQPRKSLKR